MNNSHVVKQSRLQAMPGMTAESLFPASWQSASKRPAAAEAMTLAGTLLLQAPRPHISPQKTRNPSAP